MKPSKPRIAMWQFTSDDPSEPTVLLLRAAVVRACPAAGALHPGRSRDGFYRLRSVEIINRAPNDNPIA